MQATLNNKEYSGHTSRNSDCVMRILCEVQLSCTVRSASCSCHIERAHIIPTNHSLCCNRMTSGEDASWAIYIKLLLERDGCGCGKDQIVHFI